MKRILFAAIIMASLTAGAQTKRGDVNNDGNINTADVVAIYDIIINGDQKKAVALEKKYHFTVSDDMLKVADWVVTYLDADNNVIKQPLATNTWEKSVKTASSPMFNGRGVFPAVDGNALSENTDIGLSLNYTSRNDYDRDATYDIGIVATMDYVITYEDGTTAVLPAFNINPVTPAIEGEYVDNALNAMCQTATACRDYDPENDEIEMGEFWEDNDDHYTADPEMGGDQQIDPGTIIARQYDDYEWVDLALPSGLKWATRNVGASTPYELGGLYGWGDATGYHTESLCRP